MTDEEKDLLTNHEYDGIQEFDNELPGWWLNGFYLTIVIGIVYILIFHVFNWWPLPEGEYHAEMKAAYLAHGSKNSSNNEEKSFALLTEQSDLQAGRDLYMAPKQLCYTCHGNEGQGLVGPNLTDDYWIHGYGVKQLMANITTGFPQKGMLPFGSGQRLNDTQLNQLVSYIISLRGTNPKNAKAVDKARAKLLSEEEILELQKK